MTRNETVSVLTDTSQRAMLQVVDRGANMSSRRDGGSRPAADHFEDEFDSYLDDAKQNPVFRAAFEDAEDVHRVVDSLVKLRRALKLSQTAVADRMGVRQPTVSGFETEGSDPRLSTLQRYARAVEARLRLEVQLPADCDWVCKYQGTGALAEPNASVGKGHLAEAWRRSTRTSDERVLSA